MRANAWIGIAAVVGLSCVAHGQVEERAEVQTPSSEQIGPENRVFLDAISVLQAGIGFSYERSIGESFAFGPHFSITRPGYFTSDNDTLSKVKPEVFELGFGGKYFLRKTSNGYYLAFGVNATRVSYSAVEYYQSQDDSPRYAWGPYGGFGAEFLVKAYAGGSKIIIDLGLLYGHGVALERSVRQNPDGTASIGARTTNFLYPEAKLGYVF